MRLKNIHISPRWLSVNDVQLPTGTITQVPASDLANETIHPMKLHHLVFTNDYVLGSGPLTHGNWSEYILLELGKSGCSDSNLVAGDLNALSCTPRPRINKWPWGDIADTTTIQNPCRTYTFKTPYRLPRDTGIDVTVGNRTAGTDFSKLTFVAKGFTDEGKPRILAGDLAAIVQGASVMIDSADLYNKGLTEINMVNFSIGAKTVAVDEHQADIWDPTGTRTGWLINPTSGMSWMPAPQVIPAGNIAPLSALPDEGDNQPRVYTFPPNTYLLPEQHLSVKLTNYYSAILKVNVSVIGELEVS